MGPLGFEGVEVGRGGAGCGCERVSDGSASECSLVVFSGGSAFNNASHLLKEVGGINATHILPVSDDGGSTAEIVRCLGGPALGDIRSRCLRLADDSDTESIAVKNILAHRLTRENLDVASMEWSKIADGQHDLWEGVSKPYKDTILAFLTHFRHSVSDTDFDFRNGSIGNFFFAGARTFFNSLEAAIFLFSRVAGIPATSRVIPAALSEKRVAICAELADGTIVRGQNSISHPDGSKDARSHDLLSARISRIFYEKQGLSTPAVNPAVLHSINESDAVVYAMGSLYTSIMPSLILNNVQRAIAQRNVPKILVLNGSLDRETKWKGGRMRASDVVDTIATSLNRSAREHGFPEVPASSYVTALIAPDQGEIQVDEVELIALGITTIQYVPSYVVDGAVIYNDAELVECLRELARP